MSEIDGTIVDIWEDECKALLEMPENDRLIGVQADDLLALIDEWRDLTRDYNSLSKYADGMRYGTTS